jgi:hypothetical protein
MKIANLKFEIGRNAVLKQAATGRRTGEERKRSESPAVDSYKRNEVRVALRSVRTKCSNGPMRFEEMLYSIVLQPGKIRISSRRLQRWLEFFGKH